PPDPAAVVRRGGAPATRAPRGRRLAGVEHLFYDDVVLPVVAEVVGIPELALHRGGDLLQRHPLLRAVAEPGVGLPEVAVRGVEDVHVPTVPAERDLDDHVQSVEADIGRHLESAPDRRFRSPQPHLELVRRCRQAGSLASCRELRHCRAVAYRWRCCTAERVACLAGNLRQYLHRIWPEPTQLTFMRWGG